jgi:TonB-dependent receptor
VRAEVSYTKGSQDYVQSYLRADTRTTTPIAFDFRDVDVPSVSFPSGLDPSDASQFIYRTSFDNLFEYAAEEMAARLDFKYDLDGDFLSSLEFGLRFNEIKSERVTSRDQTVFAASGASAIPVTRHPGNFELVEFDGFLDSASGEFPNAFLLAVPEFGDLAGVCRVFSPDCTPEELDPTSSYTLEEPIYAAYAQANLKSSLFSIPFTGNVGLRYVKTEVNAAGAFGIRGSADPGAFNPVEVDVSYDDWLPSAAFRFELGDEVLLRFGAARVIARPNTTQLSPSFSITTSGGGSGGNPALEPFRVNQFDVSFEWYPTRSTVLALSLFYKDVESFIYTRLVQEVIPGFDADAAAAPADRDEDPETPYRINRTFNGDGAVIKGFEVLVNQPLDFLPSPFDGFGVNATYTYIHSKSGIVDPRLGTDLSIEGLSNHNVNLVGYYEKGPFGIRVAYNWRSEYLDKIGIGGDGVYFEAYDNVSASINYKITDNVTFSLQGANLTSSPVRKYGGYEEATNTYLENGRTFTAALRFRF